MSSTHEDKMGNGSPKAPSAYAATANATPAANADIPEVPMPRAPDPALHPGQYLRSIYAVRERSRMVLSIAKRNQLRHFDVDMSKFGDTARYVCAIINVRDHNSPTITKIEADNIHRETTHRTINQYLLTADGSTLKLVDDLG